MSRPNLFDFATSELSQDALICWLLSWADSQYSSSDPALHQLAGSFIELCSSETFGEFNERNIQVFRQVGKIDIVCIINGTHVIAIEDKVGTSHHSNQLARYKEYVREILGFSPENVSLIYLQICDESCYAEVESHGYKVIHRRDILKLLESNCGQAARDVNELLVDYYSSLCARQNEFTGYQHLALDEWTSRTWKGFFDELQRTLETGKWGYVANPSGGFIAFYWCGINYGGHTLYLQLEETKFCFKVDIPEKELQGQLREKFSKIILSEASQKNLPICKPSRFGRGRWMTLATVEGDYRIEDDRDSLDFSTTVDFIQEIQKFFEEINWDSAI